MSTATRTTTARKAMRAATVFTGAAGLAVAFGPTAMAAAGQAHHGHSARAAGTTTATRQGPRTTIESRGCGDGKTTWLHVEYTSPFRDLCRQYGYAGILDQHSISMIAQCGGNNYGSLYVSGHSPISFGPGTTYRNLDYYLDAVSITHWKGTDECAWPR
jgi:hypothetical protein